MILEKTFYAVKCDNCGKLAEGYNDCEFWDDKEIATDIANDSDFYIGETIHFCSDCHMFNDENNLIIFSIKL